MSVLPARPTLPSVLAFALPASAAVGAIVLGSLAQSSGRQLTAGGLAGAAAAGPAASDFDLTVHAVRQECPGPAGCRVTVQVVADYHGAPVGPERRYEVSYVIHGGADGPVVATTQLTGGVDGLYELTEPRAEVVRVPSVGRALVAAVTDVVRR